MMYKAINVGVIILYKIREKIGEYKHREWRVRSMTLYRIKEVLMRLKNKEIEKIPLRRKSGITGVACKSSSIFIEEHALYIFPKFFISFIITRVGDRKC